MAKHKVLKVKGLFTRDEKGEVSRIDNYLYSFEEMMVRDLDDLKDQGLELFVEVEGGEIDVEEDFRFYVHEKDGELVATTSYGTIPNRQCYFTVLAKNEKDAIGTVMKELKND